jgi:hypothetical protein
LDTSKEFSKKRNKAGFVFWIAAGIVLLLIVGLLIYAFTVINTPAHR